VLVVDDDEAVRMSLQFLLEEEFDPLMADGGPAALDIFRAYPVDVVLLDVRMPHMDGLAVLRRMKALNPMVEVILVTAVIDIATVVAATKLGAFDYVAKPFDGRDLCEKVRGAVARRQREADVVLLVGSEPRRARRPRSDPRPARHRRPLHRRRACAHDTRGPAPAADLVRHHTIRRPGSTRAPRLAAGVP
jgi:DNA-binding NtrC family response regulator